MSSAPPMAIPCLLHVVYLLPCFLSPAWDDLVAVLWGSLWRASLHQGPALRALARDFARELRPPPKVVHHAGWNATGNYARLAVYRYQNAMHDDICAALHRWSRQWVRVFRMPMPGLIIDGWHLRYGSWHSLGPPLQGLQRALAVLNDLLFIIYRLGIAARIWEKARFPRDFPFNVTHRLAVHHLDLTALIVGSCGRPCATCVHLVGGAEATAWPAHLGCPAHRALQDLRMQSRTLRRMVINYKRLFTDTDFLGMQGCLASR